MFVADKIIYLQLQKTACTHIAHLLAECIGGTQIRKHNRLPDHMTGKHVIGSIRNPWDWYVSLWAFGCAGEGRLYRRLAKEPRSLPFFIWRTGKKLLVSRQLPLGNLKDFMTSQRQWAAAWRRVYQDGLDAEAFRSWLRLMFDPKRSADIHERYGQSSLSRCAGFFTYRYLWLHSRDLAAVTDRYHFKGVDALFEFDAKNNVLHSVIRNEMLEDDLIQALTVAGYPLTSAQQQKIYAGKHAKHNTSEHRPAGFYYDRETIELVAERERFLITKYGYRPPAFAQVEYVL